ncbi:hypothetical protein GCM10011317_28350 [Niveispirillum cyanobacteriorum]|nr:hypothetical protein GCM10011317_28350 [Niveispirillum cyanobacteriorum]
MCHAADARTPRAGSGFTQGCPNGIVKPMSKRTQTTTTMTKKTTLRGGLFVMRAA